MNNNAKLSSVYSTFTDFDLYIITLFIKCFYIHVVALWSSLCYNMLRDNMTIC